jgi:hypothetical protein
MNKTIIVPPLNDLEQCCLNPGCSETVTLGCRGPTTQCRKHLEEHRQRNAKYTKKKQRTLSMLKQKAELFDTLQEKYKKKSQDLKTLQAKYDKLTHDFQRATTKHIR